MSNAKIDENDRNTLTAYNETTGLVEPVRVDPTFGYLEVFGVALDSNTPTEIDHAGIDGNGRNTLSAWNETSSKIESARCGTDGSLLAIIV